MDKRRKRDSRPSLPVVLIVCEGEKTEKQYLQLLNDRNMGVTVNIRTSPEKNALGLVDYAAVIARYDGIDTANGDQVWCVFDCDENSDEELKTAEALAQQKNFQIAFSNPNFEYWLLCHFECYMQPFAHRKEVKALLKKRGHIPDYRKNGNYNDLLHPRIETAIKNARKSNSQHMPNIVRTGSNPSSTVSELADILFNLIKNSKP